MLDVCLLGSGGMMPLHHRWLTALLVRLNGKMLLIDCGEGTQIPLRQVGWGFKAIDVLCFTHYHADHVAGLPGLLLSLANSMRTEPLTMVGPPGLVRVLEGCMTIIPGLPFDVHILECSLQKEESFTINDMRIRTLHVDHSVPCLAYALEVKRAGLFDVAKAQESKVPQKLWKGLQKGEKVEYDGKVYTPDMVLGPPRKGLKLSYVTDTRPIPELVDFISQSDLFICEGMYGDDQYREKAMDKKHMLFSEAASLAREGCVRELWLTHFSPSLEHPEDFLASTREIFSNTHLGSSLKIRTLVYATGDAH